MEQSTCKHSWWRRWLPMWSGCVDAKSVESFCRSRRNWNPKWKWLLKERPKYSSCWNFWCNSYQTKWWLIDRIQTSQNKEENTHQTTWKRVVDSQFPGISYKLDSIWTLTGNQLNNEHNDGTNCARHSSLLNWQEQDLKLLSVDFNLLVEEYWIKTMISIYS